MSFTIKTIERNPKVSKKGASYTQLVITTADGRRAIGFGGKDNDSWQTGQTITDDIAVIIQQGQYYNIKMAENPKAKSATNPELEKSIDELHNKIDEIRTNINVIMSKLDEDILPI